LTLHPASRTPQDTFVIGSAGIAAGRLSNDGSSFFMLLTLAADRIVAKRLRACGCALLSFANDIQENVI
jgi:hypothetical protein